LSTIIALNKNHPAVREWARADKRINKYAPSVEEPNLGRRFAMPPNEGARGPRAALDYGPSLPVVPGAINVLNLRRGMW
jgi:hypothetical protein